MRRLLVLLASTGTVLVATTVPASAKTPPFTVELSDPTPEAGERVTVTVRMWDRVDRSKPSTLADRTLFRPGELLAVVPADEIEDGRPRPDHDQVPIALRNVAPATFQGSFVAPEQGEYGIVPLPGVERGLLLPAGVIDDYLRQYPTTELAVQRGAHDDGGWPVPPVGAVVAIGAAGALTAMRRRHPRLTVGALESSS